MDQKCRFEYKTNITATHVSKASWKPNPELRATKVPSGACRQRRRATLGLLVLNPWIGFWNSYFIWVAVGWAEFFLPHFAQNTLQADVLELTPLRGIAKIDQKIDQKSR